MTSLALQMLVNRKEISVQFFLVLCTLEAKCVMFSSVGSLPSGSGGHKKLWQYPVSFGGRGAEASLSNNLQGEIPYLSLGFWFNNFCLVGVTLMNHS